MFFLSFATAFTAVFAQTLAVLTDSVIICAFYGEAEVAAASLAGPFFYLLEIPEPLRVVSIIAIGHKGMERKPFNEDRLLWEQVHVDKF